MRLEEGPDSFSWFLGNLTATSEGLGWICKTLERDTTTKENNLQNTSSWGPGGCVELVMWGILVCVTFECIFRVASADRQ